jgi:UDP-3-O-[3-hydroxymyristoyl] glucosamine N-acyltransferase
VEITVSDLAASVGGKILSGSGAHILSGLNSLHEARSQDLSFFGNEKYIAALRKTRAGAVLVPLAFPEELSQTALIAVENPSLAFSQIMARFAPPPRVVTPGIHPTAVVAATAVLGERVTIGPHVVIEDGATIGDETEIGAGSYVGHAVQIGSGCRLFPRVTVLERCRLGHRVILHSGVVVGSDGFGYETVKGRHQKIPQIGIVQIDDDVEIGANTCLDRARFGRTRIGAGTKIDNLVQIAHNVDVGPNCIIVGQSGIAGSTHLAEGVVIAAQAGIAGHLDLASGVTVTGQSGVAKSIKTPGIYMGPHAQPMREALKVQAQVRQLPQLVERVKALEKAQEASSGSAS